MPEILRDPVWQFVGAALALGAVVVTMILYWIQRQRKALSYETISRTPLLSVEEEIKGKLQILFDGNPVQDVHLVVVRVANSGNVPIVAADYERPFNLSFDENAQILTAEVSETNPESLRASVNIETTKVVLAPVLLNSGDWIMLKMLVGQFDGQISIDGRIVGVKSIRKSVEGRAQSLALMLTGMVLVFIGVGLYARTLPPSAPSEKWDLAEKWPLILFLVGYVMMVIGMFRYSLFRKMIRRLFQ